MPKDTSRELPKDLVELIRASNTLSDKDKAYLAPHLDAVVDSTMQRRRILALVQDALGQLRLDMKYIMFDLEATRRERDSAMGGEMFTKEDMTRIRKIVIDSVLEGLEGVKDRESIEHNILSLINKKTDELRRNQ
jgi:hypothetical protein